MIDTLWAEVEGWPGGRIECRMNSTKTIHITQVVTLGRVNWYDQPEGGNLLYGPTWISETRGSSSFGPGADLLLTPTISPIAK